MECKLANSPLSIKSRLVQDYGGLINATNFSLSIYFDNWLGQYLLHASYFNAIWELIQALDNNNEIKVVWEINGNPLFSGIPNLEGINQFFDQVMPLMTFLYKARELVKSLGINP